MSMISGFNKSSPPRGLEIILKQVPLYILIQAEAAKSQERQTFLQDVWDSWGNGLQVGHRYCNRVFKEELGLPALLLDVYTTPNVYPKNLSIYIEDGKDTIITANCVYSYSFVLYFQPSFHL